VNAIAPSSLPSAALAGRLAELCRVERNVQADFLLHLSEFELRRAYLAAGYGSLWTYCLEVLHLRESAAGRRIAAMKVLRRFPALEAPLREGRLCLSTVNLLGPVLTEQNLPDLVARASFLSKADTEKLVVTIQPRVAPRDGVRRLPGAGPVRREAASPEADANAAGSVAEVAGVVGAGPAHGAAAVGVDAATNENARAAPKTVAPALLPELAGELRPISADLYSLRVTIDTRCKAELDELTVLLSHTARGKLAAVLREAIRCGIAKHGKRKGAVKPERERAPRDAAKAATPVDAQAEGTAAQPVDPQERAAKPVDPRPDGTAGQPAHAQGIAERPADPRSRVAKRFDPRAVPLAVRREVWERDGGRCAWTSPDGRRCGSRWKLELDHIDPAALGGPPTADNLRIACRPHNVFHAVEIFGHEHMAPYLGENAPAGGSHGS